MADVAELLGTIRNNGELKASVQLVPNAITGKKRVEVYDPLGRLMAHQVLDDSYSKEAACEIAFALYNGFVFGQEYTKYQIRRNFEAILLENSVDAQPDNTIERKAEAEEAEEDGTGE